MNLPMAWAPSYITSLSLQSIFRRSNRIINRSRMDSVWKVTTQSTSLSFCETTWAPSMGLGMFDRKLSSSRFVHNSLTGTETKKLLLQDMYYNTKKCGSTLTNSNMMVPSLIIAWQKEYWWKLIQVLTTATSMCLLTHLLKRYICWECKHIHISVKIHRDMLSNQ